MPEREIIHLFSYDITSDRVRLDVAKRLETFGIRVQRSVFEIRLSRERAHALALYIAERLEPGDSLRVYPLDGEAVSAAFQFGGPPISERQEFWLL